jgi:hypothetical protein
MTQGFVVNTVHWKVTARGCNQFKSILRKPGKEEEKSGENGFHMGSLSKHCL